MIDMAAAGPRSNWPSAVFTRSIDRKVVALPGPPPVNTTASGDTTSSGSAAVGAAIALTFAGHTGTATTLSNVSAGGGPPIFAMRRRPAASTEIVPVHDSPL